MLGAQGILDSDGEGELAVVEERVTVSLKTEKSKRNKDIFLPPQKMSMRDLAQDDLIDFLRWGIPEFKEFSNITVQ